MDRETLRRAMVEMGRIGGLKGGKARAERMSAAQRSASARHAARARWNSANTLKNSADALKNSDRDDLSIDPVA